MSLAFIVFQMRTLRVCEAQGHSESVKELGIGVWVQGSDPESLLRESTLASLLLGFSRLMGLLVLPWVRFHK